MLPLIYRWLLIAWVTIILPGMVSTEIWDKNDLHGAGDIIRPLARRATSAADCAKRIVGDVAAGKVESYPTIDAKFLRELRRIPGVARATGRVGTAFFRRTLH